MVQRVQGKVAIVTGAAQGIGRACAQMLALEGARVVIGDIQEAAGQAAAAAIREVGGEAIFQKVDVTEEKDCSELIEAAVRSYGRLDVLVNNAGWYPRATLEETSSDLWDRILAINLRGPFFCCKYAVPRMREMGGGSIINIGSIHGIQGQANLVAYASAKGGLLTLTKTLAGAYAADMVRVNYIIPGWVLSEGELALRKSQGTSEEDLAQIGKNLPFGRHQTPEDTAYAVIYLASDESSQITGSTFHIDGGASILPIRPRMNQPT
ncbi:SDR family NAD(P)-dependent oxidoreductase [Dictyobacter aurantiacus]|uniref:Putative oxidoreductase n=1 Tax=Dictyobacter aurantiacus TaxID=1936993 RepID=A0A401ZNT9_9CHLR|nr:SDR family NAD(P)-dependent oxidoreductase [Dictyobacter aurantiacus]GCE08512.1 putative oxidoreductase [Dictyobacter aurantiacus]